MKKKLITIYLFFFFLLSIFVSGNVDSQDGFLYLAVARNIYYKGEITGPVYEGDIKKNIHMGTYVGKDGRTYSPTGLGYSIALIPAVALTDLVYKLYGVTPNLEHFPLENDWVTLMTASFTNVFFGALLGTVIFLYLFDLGLNRKQAFLISVLGLLGTNLWVYTKHSFAHMMFISFLVLSFYCLRKFAKSSKKVFLIGSALAYGVVTLTYNQTFAFSILPLTLYYLLLTNFRFNKKCFKKAIKNLLIFTAFYLPFIFVFFWFEDLRHREWTYFGNEDFIRQYSFFFGVPISVFIEGIYGQLFSPGRSIFIYSPILLLILFFHHKIKNSFRPELLVFLLLTLTYLIFFASLYVIEDPKYGARGLWDGEFSWGPRYLLTLIPFGILLIGGIYKELSKKQRLFIFAPLIALGVFINILGIVQPYQIKLRGLENEFIINGQKYTHFSYSNLLPRYTPIFTMSKELAKLVISLPEKLDHGDYNARLFDGFDFPLPMGSENWRPIKNTGLISFNAGEEVNTISVELINHSNGEASESADLVFILNNDQIARETLESGDKRRIDLKPSEHKVLDKDNQLKIVSLFNDPAITAEDKQFTALVNFYINDSPVNIQTMDYPYVSKLGPVMTGQNYQTFGGLIQDPWVFWHIHSQIFERTPDFWWMRPLFYWDLPRPLFLVLFLGNVIGLGYFGYKTFRLLSNGKNT